TLCRVREHQRIDDVQRGFLEDFCTSLRIIELCAHETCLQVSLIKIRADWRAFFEGLPFVGRIGIRLSDGFEVVYVPQSVTLLLNRLIKFPVVLLRESNPTAC